MGLHYTGGYIISFLLCLSGVLGVWLISFIILLLCRQKGEIEAESEAGYSDWRFGLRIGREFMTLAILLRVRCGFHLFYQWWMHWGCFWGAPCMKGF